MLRQQTKLIQRMHLIQISEIWPDKYLPDILQHIWPEMEPYSVVNVPLPWMLMMCMKVYNLHINCSFVLISVIWFVLLLFHTVVHNIWLFEFQLVFTDDIQLIRFLYAAILTVKYLWYLVPFNNLAGSRTGTGYLVILYSPS